MISLWHFGTAVDIKFIVKIGNNIIFIVVLSANEKLHREAGK